MHPDSDKAQPRDIILHALQHLDHVLPGQAPIHNFVHHNTLHGFQHLPFEQALCEFEALTGVSSYWPEAQFRDFYRQGRIDETDLAAAIARHFAGGEKAIVCKLNASALQRADLYRLALLHDLSAISAEQWIWQTQEMGALERVQADVPAAQHDIWQSRKNHQPVRELWQTLLDKLALSMPPLHPEDGWDLATQQTASGLAAADADTAKQASQASVDKLFAEVGEQLSLRGLLQALTGVDILEQVRPQLIRVCASLLDEGMAAWRLPQCAELGLYAAWRQSSRYDMQPFFNDLSAWNPLSTQLPDEPVAAIEYLLNAMAIPLARWPGYLQRLALELPGWSGLINWRQQHPHYHAADHGKPQLADYLAIRLSLDSLWLHQLCQEQWRSEARFDKLQAYFHKNPAEFSVRQMLFGGQLPEYLAQQAQTLLGQADSLRADWQTLAEQIARWQHSPLTGRLANALSVYDHGWRLFRLCQLLGWDSACVDTLSQAQLLEMLAVLDQFDLPQRRSVWLDAYERHYQHGLFQALRANHQRGRWAQRERRAEAQICFCMDEREESFRRHLEELNPAIETLGAAGFFGVAMNFKALDDSHFSPLCPVVVVPAHQVEEVAQPNASQILATHNSGRRFAQRIAYWLNQTLRSNLLLAYPLLYGLAPFALTRLLAKTLTPAVEQSLEATLHQRLIPSVPTRLHFVAAPDARGASPEQPQAGFSDEEQAVRVAQFLKTTGLTYGFARLVAIMGHGSTSQNNPHEAAHDCGACGGKRGGPNARLFAAMANRPAVRHRLKDQGIAIPDDTWFVGGQHDTCSDRITWYDLDLLPPAFNEDFHRFHTTLIAADQAAAAERCRRFASAGGALPPRAGLRHVELRSDDLSQVRPEFGHATNAAALIGRRSVSQGLFLDRRMFLISYDPSQDPDGLIVENILLTAGPVGAGINLEYYFSTVNNERLGCGTKIPHNVTGLFGVMEGASSDLRTGLPLQMVEIHEAMRLQIIVEAKTTVLEQIYGRQAALRELIDGGWVHLSAIDPDNGRIFVFQRGVGFVAWQAEPVAPPLRDSSADCYRQESGPVPPMLIKQATGPDEAVVKGKTVPSPSGRRLG